MANWWDSMVNGAGQTAASVAPAGASFADKIFSGLQQGYMDAGGVTPGNVFNGPTPMAGDAPAGFAGGLGDFLGGLGGRVTDLALHTLPEFIKDPSAFFNDQGELSITRVISPDFRRNAVKQRKQGEEGEKAMLVARGLTQFNEFAKSIVESPANQRAALVAQAESLGVPPDQIESALAQANQQDQARQQAVGVLAPALQGVPNAQQLTEMILSPDPTQQSAGELALRAQQARSRDAAISQRAEARAVAANKPKLTNEEELLNAYRDALDSGDQMRIAVTRSAVEKIGKSGQPMVVTRPDGSAVVGGASDVQGFESTTARDRALATIDSNDALLDTIGEMRALAARSPEAFGAAGAVGAFKQNLAAQGRAFSAMGDKALADARAGGVDPGVAKQIADSFNKDIPGRVSLEMTLAYAKARANNPDGKISDSDFNAALATVRGQAGEGGLLSNADSTKAILDILEREATRDKKRARFRAGKSGKERSPLSAALDAEEERRGLRQPAKADEKKPAAKGKLGKKNKKKGVLAKDKGEGLSEDYLRGLSPSEANIENINDLNDTDFDRWKALHPEATSGR